MSTSNTRTKYFRSTVGKIVMALTFASVISGLSLVPALGQENERRQGQQRQGQQRQGQWRQGQQRPGQWRPEQRERGWYGRERQAERRWHAREWRGERGRRASQPYGYSAPFYVPPPPGINLFFPLHIR